MNQLQDISDLYNSLFELESKFKNETAYPIHKRMNFGNQFGNVYEFLVSKIDIHDKVVLDAGCGVGFGTFLIAKRDPKKVKGISVSSKEINRANEVKNRSNIDNISFEVATFDDINSNQFDIIICVESLKHTLDFENTYVKILNGLKPKGMLCIIDDFFDGNENKTSEALKKDWHLNFLITLSHLKVDQDKYDVIIEDLTPWIHPKNLLRINLKIQFFALFKRNSSLKKLFKGGLLLDKLYAKKQMNYSLVQIKKK
jgi:ubiquinone/menaquinone biosynthesis C-methylase UbiE